MKIFKIVFFILLAGVFFLSCKKEFSYESGNIKLTQGTWQFQNGAVQYNGNVDSSFIRAVNTTKILTITGKSLSGQENFTIRLYTTDSFTTTSYLASLSQSQFDYFTSSKTIFKGDVLAGEFIVTITSLSNNSITGTFSGLAEDSTGGPTQINLGSFTSAIDLSNNGSGSGGGAQSVGTLGANPDSCTPVALAGVYTSGIPLSPANTVQVQVNVTTPGSYIIATNSVNGVRFFLSGVFTTTGIQNVILPGSGTPQQQGVQYFTVTYGTSNCIFPVTFLAGTTPTGDYFPTTIGSNWAYGLEGGTPSDSILAQIIPYAPTINNNVYASLTTEDIPSSGSANDTSYFRKSGNDYITNINVQDFFQFDSPVSGEYVFLNDDAAGPTSFRSPDFTGTVSGAAATGYIQVTITERGVPATVGGLDFNDVIKVTYEYYYTNLPVAFITEERWFARGVGLIYDNINDAYVTDIGRYKVF